MAILTEESVTRPDVVFQGTDGSECLAFLAAINDHAMATGRDGEWRLGFARTRLRGAALRWYAHRSSSIGEDWELLVKALLEQYPHDEVSAGAGTRTPAGSTMNSPELSATHPHPGAGITSPGLPPQAPTISTTSTRNNDTCAQCFSHEPFPSARQYDPSSTGQQMGLLRIVTEAGTTLPQYVWWGYTVDEQEIARTELDGHSYSRRQRATFNHDEALIVSFLPSSEPHTIGCLVRRCPVTAFPDN
ncbi:hypothetical protein FRB90_001637 [Tulasnella sp. 427]|nr:hypothetical protein FRB90_001637 [Tulasnella sp. 427]